MRRYFKIIAIFLFMVTTSSCLLAQLPRLSGVSLYADVRASKVGDIVLIFIDEAITASNNNNTQTDKREDLTINNEAGTGSLKLIPGFGISSENRNRYQGTAQVSSNSRLETQISTRIVKVLENGYFMLEGVREVEANGEKTTMTITGIVRPYDIAKDNTVQSSQVADLQVFLTGKGVTTQGNRPGLFTRILNWIF